MYQIENPIGKAMSGMNQASGTYGSMMKDIPANRDPGHTWGGGAMAAMGGAAMGAQIGSLVPGIGTAIGAGVGALIGAGGYLSS
jgi:phage tail tape-measure protein